MKRFSFIKILLLGVMLASVGLKAEAQMNYYVSQFGGGLQNGTQNNPAPWSTLRNYLLSGSFSAGTTLTVYFSAGTYEFSAATSNTSANHFSFSNNLNSVTFRPLTPPIGNNYDVVFQGSSTGTNFYPNVRFAAMPTRTTNATLFTFNVEGVKIANFSTTANGTVTDSPSSQHLDGRNSLFTIATGSTINISNALIDNISSGASALMGISTTSSTANGAFNVTNSTLSNISNVINQAILRNNNAANVSIDNCVIDNWKIGGAITGDGTGSSTSSYAQLFRIAYAGSHFSFTNNTVKNITANAFLFAYQPKTINVSNNTFDGSNSKISILMNINSAAANSLVEIKNNTIKNYIVYNGSTGNHLFLFSSSAYLRNNTIVGNTPNGDIVRSPGTSFIYNNTFSGNTPVGYCMTLGTASAKAFNNTIYNSGRVNLTAAAGFANNIVYIYPIPATNSYTGTTTYCYRNTQTYNGRLYFNTSGNTNGDDITVAFQSEFNTTLSNTNVPGMDVHSIFSAIQNNSVIMGKAGTLNQLYSNLSLNRANFASCIYDQVGHLRPANLSVGAFDVTTFQIVATRTISSVYNADKGETAPAVTFDVSRFVSVYPTGATNVPFVLSGTPTNGTITPEPSLGPTYYTFTPTPGLVNDASSFDVTVTATDAFGSLHTRTFDVRTFVYDVSSYHVPTDIPPGYTITTGTTCLADMGSVVFTQAYRFKSKDVPGNGTGASDHVSTFSIPLVADLDGDGIPEILGFGVNWNADATTGQLLNIHVFNGQTGERIAKMAYKTSSGAAVTTAFTHAGWHSSPAMGALVRTEGPNSPAELIVAFTNAGGDASLQNKLVSYKIVKIASSGTSQYELQWKWTSHDGVAVVNYNAGNTNYHKGTPQICDLDGDGEPEVLVYNKIFNARTGQLLCTIEDLGSTLANPTAYMGINKNSYEMGNSDYLQSFSYIYDMDLDGVYDIVAGGKIYKINVNSAENKDSKNRFSYTTVTMSGVADGYTGVADIDGDGVADVVVVRQSATTAAGDIEVTVWNPKFTGSSILGTLSSSPVILAQQMIDVTNRQYGSNSYVFIGDIDGREQTVGGKTYRLPEIAVLTGQISFSGNGLSIHPNVSGIPVGDNAGEGGIPASGNTGTSISQGALFALTFDLNATTTNTKLKLSFVLEHSDNSDDTGFTMFDFDNDGIQEICYRDNSSLRIIKPLIPYVKRDYDETATKPAANGVVLLKTDCRSATGFEYPVIADIDNDASAEMVVVGRDTGGGADQHYAYVYAVGTNGDKFAPARKVWNQFIYDPFKINEDLTTPTGPAINRLDPVYSYTHIVKENDGSVTNVKENFSPYNGTLIQPALYSLTVNESYGYVYDPVVYLPDAYIVSNTSTVISKRPTIVGSSSPYSIDLTIGNLITSRTAVSLNTPVMVYKNSITKENIVAKKTIGELFTVIGGANGSLSSSLVSSPLQPGTEVCVRISDARIDDIDAVYHVRLGDDSDEDISSTVWAFGLNSESDGIPDARQGIGLATRAFRDCNWDNQYARAARYNVFNDAATVQIYKQVEIDVLSNDILPQSCLDTLSVKNIISSGPTCGVLSFKGSKIVYQNTGVTSQLPDGIDSFQYTVKYHDDVDNKDVSKTATVYIYVLQSISESFVACSTNAYIVSLKPVPTNNVSFYWYNSSHTLLQTTPSNTWTISGTNLKEIKLFVEPQVTKAIYSSVFFPAGELTVSFLNPSLAHVLKWTGAFNNDWNHPYNWVDMTSGNETMAQYAPSACVNVIIPSGVTNYPILSGLAICKEITMDDRAMIKGINYLTYENAKVEITLKPEEHNRFLMWSAPLKGMYSGDYYYERDGANQPIRGNVYMSYFQSVNPDNTASAAVANTFTNTFGKLNSSLGLGKAFLLKVDRGSGYNSTFSFPKTEMSYKNSDGSTVNIPAGSRGTQSKFVTDGVLNANGSMLLPVEGDNAFQAIMVVNPFMAYLNVKAFLDANTATLQSEYKIWDGNINSGFISFKALKDDEDIPYQRYLVDFADAQFTGNTVGYIAPLQSFFVMKKTATTNISELVMDVDMTTVSGVNPYTLTRSGGNDAFVNTLLQINATQGMASNSTTLYCLPGATSDYNDNEDSYKLFNEENPITVYTLTSANKALAINSQESFISNVKLGLRLKNSGTVTLDFSDLSAFGFNTYLVDKALGNKRIDLSKQSTYTFSVEKPAPLSPVSLFEINERFVLEFGTRTGIEDTEDVGISVTAVNQDIIVTAPSGNITHLQVYNTRGDMVYTTFDRQNSYTIPVSGKQLYMVRVKVNTDNNYTTHKVMVK